MINGIISEAKEQVREESPHQATKEELNHSRNNICETWSLLFRNNIQGIDDWDEPIEEDIMIDAT